MFDECVRCDYGVGENGFVQPTQQEISVLGVTPSAHSNEHEEPCILQKFSNFQLSSSLSGGASYQNPFSNTCSLDDAEESYVFESYFRGSGEPMNQQQQLDDGDSPRSIPNNDHYRKYTLTDESPAHSYQGLPEGRMALSVIQGQDHPNNETIPREDTEAASGTIGRKSAARLGGSNSLVNNSINVHQDIYQQQQHMMLKRELELEALTIVRDIREQANCKEG